MAVFALLHYELFESSARMETARSLCGVSLEHAAGIRVLIGHGLNTSAISLARTQFETLVRGMWALYAASETDIGKLSNELTLENEQKASQMPMLSNMILSLDGKAPPQAIEMLNGYKECHWKTLNSFTHGGIHAVKRFEEGYPESLLEQLLKSVNGVTTMTAMLLAILIGDSELVSKVSKIQYEFSDCLPELLHRNT